MGENDREGGEPETAAWIRAAREGDRGAYARLAIHWYRRTLAFCHTRLPQTSDAEDAAQETLIKAFLHLHELRDSQYFALWLRGIAANVCRDFWRRQKHQPTLIMFDASACEPTQPFWGQDGRDPSEVAEEREQVWRAIGELDEPLREVILLHYFEQLTYDQMARWLGVARATVQERLTKARQQLRFRLARPLHPPQ